MRLKFNLQMFGGIFGGGGGSEQVRKRDPEPDELIDIQKKLYESLVPGVERFSWNDFDKAKENSDMFRDKQKQLADTFAGTNDEMLNFIRSGNIPQGMTDSMNASVNKELQGGMGNMLNSLGARGVLNSSITGQGISRLGSQAADAYNKNYLSAYNSVLGGYNSSLGNSLQGINSFGEQAANAYNTWFEPLKPAYNLWKDWKTIHNSKDDYDTVVKQGK